MKRLWHWLKIFILVALAIGCVRAVFITTYFIPDRGVESALFQGEGITVNRWSYGFKVPFTQHRIGKATVRRGELVVYRMPVQEEGVMKEVTAISRCVALPGDTVWLDKHQLPTRYRYKLPPSQKQLYAYRTNEEDDIQELLGNIGADNNILAGYTTGDYFVRSLNQTEYTYLHEALGDEEIIRPLHEVERSIPQRLVLPRAGQKVRIDSTHVRLYAHIIARYEGRNATVNAHRLYIDGRYVNVFTFSRNYYWMLSNDPLSQKDSRYAGMIPENAIIGRAGYIWWTKSFDRLFTSIL